MRNSVAAGWLGFWELRVTPTGDYREPRHGNTIHGSYSKAGRRSVHLARVMIAISHRLDEAPSGAIVPARLSGWRYYPQIRNPTPNTPSRAENPG